MIPTVVAFPIGSVRVIGEDGGGADPYRRSPALRFNPTGKPPLSRWSLGSLLRPRG